MKIISDLPDYIISRIRKTISDGQYKSISDFILMATENQLALESGEINNVLDISNENSKDSMLSIIKNFSIINSEIPILEYFPAREGKDIWDNWIWGQINRIFPIKFAARFLAIESSRLGSYPEKENFNKIVSKEARDLGIILKNIDSILDKERDKKLSTGFPIGRKIENSLKRYWSQFVGYQKSDKTLTGALFDLALANLFTDEDGVLRIGLNSKGKKFSQLNNPILDNKDFSCSLSELEISFYLEHIKSNVPGEFSLFSNVLNLLINGIERREEMNVELARLIKGSGWSDSLISTQRAGAISRLFELGLVSKERIGLEVRYHITERGKTWLGIST